MRQPVEHPHDEEDKRQHDAAGASGCAAGATTPQHPESSKALTDMITIRTSRARTWKNGISDLARDAARGRLLDLGEVEVEEIVYPFQDGLTAHEERTLHHA